MTVGLTKLNQSLKFYYTDLFAIILAGRVIRSLWRNIHTEHGERIIKDGMRCGFFCCGSWLATLCKGSKWQCFIIASKLNALRGKSQRLFCFENQAHFSAFYHQILGTFDGR